MPAEYSVKQTLCRQRSGLDVLSNILLFAGMEGMVQQFLVTASGNDAADIEVGEPSVITEIDLELARAMVFGSIVHRGWWPQHTFIKDTDPSLILAGVINA